jgi:hypothetical protein
MRDSAQRMHARATSGGKDVLDRYACRSTQPEDRQISAEKRTEACMSSTHQKIDRRYACRSMHMKGRAYQCVCIFEDDG